MVFSDERRAPLALIWFPGGGRDARASGLKPAHQVVVQQVRQAWSVPGSWHRSNLPSVRRNLPDREGSQGEAAHCELVGVCRSYDGAVSVDVFTSVGIARPRDEVAAFACDPNNATPLYANTKSVEWKSPRPLAVGSRVAWMRRADVRRLRRYL
jgi:hypothetical protein